MSEHEAGARGARSRRSPAVAVALAVAVTVALAVGTAAPATAATGSNHDLWIATPAAQNPTSSVRVVISPFWTGRYHIHFWMSATPYEDWNSPELHLVGGRIYTRTYNLKKTEIYNIHRGEILCAELWLWAGDGWESRGLPCIKH